MGGWFVSCGLPAPALVHVYPSFPGREPPVCLRGVPGALWLQQAVHIAAHRHSVSPELPKAAPPFLDVL